MNLNSIYVQPRFVRRHVGSNKVLVCSGLSFTMLFFIQEIVTDLLALLCGWGNDSIGFPLLHSFL